MPSVLFNLAGTNAGCAGRSFAVALLMLWLQDVGAAADEDNTAAPRWEAGLGLSTLHVPDYRGSREASTVVLPFPYVVLRSRIFTADREGVRGDLWESDVAQLTFSISGSLTTDADDNPLREGMSELNPTLELGPVLKINLSGDELDSGWEAQLPLRAVLDWGDGLDIGYVGWVFEPRLVYTRHYGRWRARFSSGVRFGDEKYHDYYYQVDDSEVTAARPVYDARAGYSGLVSGVSVLRRAGNWWFGGFARYDWLGGARFEDSPLVQTRNYATVGVAVGWVFARSRVTVPLD